MEFISKILQAILEAALPILVSAAAAWMLGQCVKLGKTLRDKNPQLYEILRVTCNAAVTAAEQLYESGQGMQKKAYALNIVEKYLKAKGINLDIDIIGAYIEAAVKDLKDTGREKEHDLSGESEEESAHVCENGVCSLS